MNDARPRVLLITRNLPPVMGGMERLVGHIAATLSTRFATAIVGPHRARVGTPPAAYLGCPRSPLAAFLAVSAFRSRSAARKFRPQRVLAGSGLTAPAARLAARQANAPYAVYLHGLDIAAPHPIYRRLFVPAIRRADLVIANSRYTARIAVESGVPEARVRVLHPGVALPGNPDGEAASGEFRKRYGLPDEAVVLFGAGRLTPRKGFAAFVAKSLPAVVAALPDAHLVIAGEVPRHAAQRGGDEAAAVRRAAAAAGLADRVHLIGSLDDTALSQAWSAAAVHVFPVRADSRDPEGFGMVAIEAAAHGVPTVAFACGGIPDAVAEGGSGFLVASGDYDAFSERVVEAVRRGNPPPASARVFAEGFAWDHFDRRLLELVEGLVRMPPASSDA